MRQAKVAFVIAGKSITKQSRTFWWDEDEKDKALNLLSCLDGLTTDQALNVIFGRSKLVGDSATGIGIESDDAAKSPCGNPMKGTLIDFLRIEKEMRRGLEDDLKDQQSLSSGDSTWSPSQYGPVELGPRALKKVREGKTTFAELKKRGLLKEMSLGPVLTPLHELKEKIREMDDADDGEPLGVADAIEEEETAPKPDSELKSRNGWVDREGRFFPCRNYMEHIYLAELLGFDERKLEVSGWVKISDYTTAPVPVPPRDVASYDAKISPTDAQIKVVVDWCAKHKHPIPEWCEEE